MLTVKTLAPIGNSNKAEERSFWKGLSPEHSVSSFLHNWALFCEGGRAVGIPQLPESLHHMLVRVNCEHCTGQHETPLPQRYLGKCDHELRFYLSPQIHHLPPEEQ